MIKVKKGPVLEAFYSRIDHLVWPDPVAVCFVRVRAFVKAVYASFTEQVYRVK